LLGAWVVVAETSVQLKKRFIYDALFMVGLAICMVAIRYYEEHMRFPGITALIPALAVAMMIFSGERSRLSSIFANATARFFGKISYSLYLVHWPLVVFYKNIHGYHLSLADKSVLLATSVVLAWLLWRYVEQPFRRGSGKSTGMSDKRFYAGLASAVSVVICLSYLAYSQNGFLWRLNQKSQSVYKSYKQELVKRTLCKEKNAVAPGGFGCFGDQSKDPAKVLLIGDSHVNNFVYGLSDLLAELGVKGRFRVANGCPPIMGATVIHLAFPAWSGVCDRSRNISFREARKEQFDVVVLAGRWSLYTNVTRLGVTGSQTELFLGMSPDDERNPQRSQFVFRTKMESTIRDLVNNHKKVIVFGQVPDIGFEVKRCLFRPNFFNLELAGCSLLTTREMKDNIAFTNETLQHIAQEFPGQVLYLDSSLAFCQPDCEYMQGDIPLYTDNNHLAYSGSLKVVQQFSGEIERFIADARAKPD
ncbi:MAG: acyltransferase family protein, partial [Halioglobus sp.]